MEIQILGSGSASDPTLPNSSVVVTCGGQRIMIDCGYSVAREAIAAFRDPDKVDALVFTHHHPDHCFGFVPTMIAWSDAGRRKPLTVATTDWGRRQLLELQRLGLGSAWRAGFEFHWHAVPEPLTLGSARVSFAPTEHSVPNHAIRIDADGGSFAYSGDGRPTPQSRALFAGADLLMHECYSLTALPEEPWHCSFEVCRTLPDELPVGRLLVYHIREDQRPTVAAAAAGEARIAVATTGALVKLALRSSAEETTPAVGGASPRANCAPGRVGS